MLHFTFLRENTCVPRMWCYILMLFLIYYRTILVLHVPCFGSIKSTNFFHNLVIKLGSDNYKFCTETTLTPKKKIFSLICSVTPLYSTNTYINLTPVSDRGRQRQQARTWHDHDSLRCITMRQSFHTNSYITGAMTWSFFNLAMSKGSPRVLIHIII